MYICKHFSSNAFIVFITFQLRFSFSFSLSSAHINIISNSIQDAEDFVEHRVKELLKGGAVSACVAISKTESRNALDHLARVMCAFCKQQSFSGMNGL